MCIRDRPIGCVIVVTRVPDSTDTLGGVFDNQKSGQIGLYVGPSMVTPGCVRVAVVTRGTLKILTTGNFQSASDGGGLNIYPHIERGVSKLIKEQRSELNKTVDVLHEPEEEHQKEVEIQTTLSEEPLYSDTPNFPTPVVDAAETPKSDDCIPHISNPSENVLSSVTENIPSVTIVEGIPSVDVTSVEVLPLLLKFKCLFCRNLNYHLKTEVLNQSL